MSMPSSPSPGASSRVSASTAPELRSTVTATSDSTIMGMAVTAMRKASAPARLMTSSMPLAPSAWAWCGMSSVRRSSVERVRPKTW